MIRSEYYIRLADYDGNTYNIIDDFISLSYTKRLNDVGMITFTLPQNHDAITGIETDNIIAVVRGQSHPSVDIAHAVDTTGLWRGDVRETNEFDNERITFYAPDGISLLARTIIAFRAGTTGAAWTGVESDALIKDLISQNALSVIGSRLLPKRPVAQVIAGGPAITTPTMDYNAAYKNLLEAVRTVAGINNDYFLANEPTNRFFAVDVDSGTDRTASVLFDLGRANMTRAQLDERRIYEPTVALVAGQGEGAARTAVVRYSATYAGNNHTEIFVDARDATTTAELEARGDAKLADYVYRPKFNFRAVQTPSCLYGKDYFLGDTVKALYQDTMFTQRIVGVTVGVNEDGKESIELDLDNV